MKTVRLVPSGDADALLPLLRDAEEGDSRILQAIAACDAYLAFSGDSCIGAAVVRWSADESEIIYMATRSELRGQGFGRALVGALFDEARQRAIPALSVGTANCSLSNIAFYQKCGFRIDSVRKNYFDYLPAPISEDGILMRDMLVLRAELTA